MKKMFLLGIMLFSAPAFADTVILTDGKSLQTGNCEVVSNAKVVCRSEDGSRSINLPLKAIREISSSKEVMTQEDLTRKASELESAAVFRKEEKNSDISVTLQKFNLITQGMTYSEVKRIVGAGKEVNRVEAGNKFVTFQWEGTGGGAMQAAFEGNEKDDDDALVLKAKAQKMLK